MRHREPLNPEAVRELDAIDRALAGEPVDHDLRELSDLVRDVRASAPEMSPALTARLERELQQGFAPAVATGKAKRKRPRLMVLVPAAGTVAAVIVAIVVLGQGGETINYTSSDGQRIEDTGGGAAASAPSAVEPSVQKEATQTAQRSSGANSGAGADLAATRERKVQRRVALVLETGENKVESTADDVIRTVDRFRGIVASSSISADDAAGSEAVFDLRIPTSRLDDALAALSKLGHVAERRQDLQDITAAFTSTRERLTDARAERRGLLRALGNATTEAQIESLRARLRLVRGQIAAAKAELSTLQRRASLSTVSLTVRGDGKAGGGGGGWSIGDAGGDAVRALEVIAAVALITIAVTLPLALLGAVILFGAHLARARRRENALDAP
ncbi:MAG: DUF4349 domain-containing protein [Solirubrobacteraceae bacterium]